MATNGENIFLRRVGLVSIGKVIIMLSSMILTPILTKTLPASEFAIWVQVMVTLGFMLPVADLGLTTAMLRFFPTENNKTELSNKFKTVLMFTLTTSIILSLLPLIAIHQVANLLFGGWEEVVYYLPLIFPVVFMNNLCMCFFRARQQIKKHSLFTIVQIILITGMVGLSAISHPNVIQALAAYTIVQFTIFWAMLALIIREIGIGTASLKHLKEYLRFGLPVLPQSLATWLIVGSDRFLIGMFIGLTYVGYYAPAYGVGSTVMMFMAPLGTLLPSALSELHDIGREAEMWKRIKQSLIAYLILAIPAGIVVSIFARNILIIFSTAEIAANSYQIVPVMVMATIIYSGQAILSNVLIVKKKMIVLTWITIITAIVSVGANLILIPRYGLLGAATALYIAYMVQMVLTAHQSFKTYRDWKDNHTMPLCNGR